MKHSVAALDRAMLQKDTVALVKLLHTNVTYGHSNGWVETKPDVIRDLQTGYLVYDKLDASDMKIMAGEGWASVRMKLNAKGKVNNKDFDLQLHVLQVWKRVKKGWQLIARQSTKVN